MRKLKFSVTARLLRVTKKAGILIPALLLAAGGAAAEELFGDTDNPYVLTDEIVIPAPRDHYTEMGDTYNPYVLYEDIRFSGRSQSNLSWLGDTYNPYVIVESTH